MSVCHPSVYPVEAAPLPLANGHAVVPSRVRMKVIEGMSLCRRQVVTIPAK
ncbi:hypothetical protein Hanom_Chr10g00949211 [Helianthus anomalus]